MHTIKQAAARSGLSVPTVRAWERRYGVVDPERTPTGYRLYNDKAIARLIAMRHLVEHEGIRPSQAAKRVLTAGEDLADLILIEARSSGTEVEPVFPETGSSRESRRRRTVIGRMTSRYLPRT